MAEIKCCICGFSFPAKVMRYLKKCFFCPDCWKEREARLKDIRFRSNRLHLLEVVKHTGGDYV